MNGLESPETDILIYGHFFYDKDDSTTVGERVFFFFKTNSAKPIGIHMRKRNVDHYLTSYIKINSIWITDPNMKGETVKLLKQNMGVEHIFINLGLRNKDFLNRTKKKKRH